MPSPLEATDKFLSPGYGWRVPYRLLADNVYAPVVYAIVSGGAAGGSQATTTVDGGNVAIGATTDTPATSDTAAASLIAIQKRSNQLQTLNWGAKLTAAPALGAGGSGGIGWLSQISTQLPASLGGKATAGSLSITHATDDPGIGAPVTAAGALGAGGSGLQGWISNISLRLPLATKTAAGSLSVTLASDDAQIGTKVTTVPALASGGTGLIGWLSALWQSLSNLALQLPATLGIKGASASLSVVPAGDANVARETYGTVTNLTVPTLAAGATFNAFAAQACTSLDLLNTSTVDIEYRRGGAGTAIPIPAGASRLLQGITNASQISIRRVDQIGNPVNVFAEAFAV